MHSRLRQPRVATSQEGARRRGTRPQPASHRHRALPSLARFSFTPSLFFLTMPPSLFLNLFFILPRLLRAPRFFFCRAQTKTVASPPIFFTHVPPPSAPTAYTTPRMTPQNFSICNRYHLEVGVRWKHTWPKVPHRCLWDSFGAMTEQMRFFFCTVLKYEQQKKASRRVPSTAITQSLQTDNKRCVFFTFLIKARKCLL